MSSTLRAIKEWKKFERLCADLLAAEGFILESEPSIDRTGVDLRVTEEYRAHEPGRVIQVHWRVQCKHLAISGKNLGRKEVEEALVSFEATRGASDGLFLIVSTDYTEAAKETIDAFLRVHPSSRVTLWNQRQLESRLERHPHLIQRYGLSLPPVDYIGLLADLKEFGAVETLVISDQSVFVHNLASGMRHAGFDVTFLPFWNYNDPLRLALFLVAAEERKFRLVIVSLGDSFGLPMRTELTEAVVGMVRSGASALFLPFLAWSMKGGMYPDLAPLSPAVLLDRGGQAPVGKEERILGEYRRGDFRWALSSDAFVEDRYVEIDPLDGAAPFTRDIEGRFGLAHSFEFLAPAPDAAVAWADTTGNPVLLTRIVDGKRLGYLNTCCHSCMSHVAVSSPLEASLEFATLVRNTLRWLLSP